MAGDQRLLNTDGNPSQRQSKGWKRKVLPLSLLLFFLTCFAVRHSEIRRAPDMGSSSDTDLVASSGTASLVQTAEGPERELWVQKPDMVWAADFEAPIVVDVSSRETDQELIGFGGAFTESAAFIFYKLSEATRQELLSKYFSLDGLGYVIGRTHINSCDFSLASYSFDDVREDLTLEHFDTTVQHDVDSGLILFIKEAQQKISETGRSLKLLASPWSPPAWMKLNKNMSGSTWHGEGVPDPLMNESNTLNPRYYGVWGEYIAKWISSYKAHRIPVWGITVQNEGLEDQTWESNVMTAVEQAVFVAYSLGPAMKAVHPDVLIFAYDHYFPDPYGTIYVSTLFSTDPYIPSASKYLSGIGWHWYAGDMFYFVEKTHKDYPQLLLLATEATYEAHIWHHNNKDNGTWRFGEGYGHDIIGNLNAGANAWLDWNLLLDMNGGPNHVGNVCDNAVMANTSTSTLFFKPQFWYMGHFSKYILPGSKRVKSIISGSAGPIGPERQAKRARAKGYGYCGEEDGLEATVWQRPDAKIVTVVLNCGGSAIEFKIKDGVHALRAVIPPHAIQTYMFDRI